jgi:hypothetical protein
VAYLAISNERAKELLISGAPVMRDGIMYKKISALVFRMGEGLVDPYAEVLDMNTNSVVVCPLKWLDEVNTNNINDVCVACNDTVITMYNKCKDLMGELSSFIYSRKYDQAQGKINNLLRHLMRLEGAMGVFDDL